MVRPVAGWITALTREQWERGIKPIHNLSDSLLRWCHPLTQAVTTTTVTLDAWMHDITKHPCHSSPGHFPCPSFILPRSVLAYRSAFPHCGLPLLDSNRGGNGQEETALVFQGDSDKRGDLSTMMLGHMMCYHKRLLFTLMEWNRISSGCWPQTIKIYSKDLVKSGQLWY